MTGKQASLRVRFERHYIPEPNSGCWIWTGALDWGGYGLIAAPWKGGRRSRKASQIAWELFRGSRKRLHVLHSCDNRACVNPDHLHLGTNADNVKERDARKRRAPPAGIKNGNAVLTEEIVKAIRLDPRSPPEIAKAYGIHRCHAWAVKRGTVWKHIK